MDKIAAWGMILLPILDLFVLVLWIFSDNILFGKLLVVLSILWCVCYFFGIISKNKGE